MNCLSIRFSIVDARRVSKITTIKYHPYVMCEQNQDITTGSILIIVWIEVSVVLAKEYQILPDLTDDLTLDVGIAIRICIMMLFL